MEIPVRKPPFAKEFAPLAAARNGPEIASKASSIQSPRPSTEEVYTDRVKFSEENVVPFLWIYNNELQSLSTVQEIIHYSFDLERLHVIHKWLWLAGLRRPARSLHRQKMMGRQLVITEQSELHLTWRDSTLFVKPLWKPLLDHEFWKAELCLDQDNFRSAAGLLRSYTWLITAKSDLQIAKQHHLVPKKLKWKKWVAFSRSFLRALDNAGHDNVVACRYQYGELRLNRLNLIYRFAPAFFPKHLLRGYFYGYNQYSVFFGRNFAWAAAVAVYFSLLLTAMNVARSIDFSQGNPHLQKAAFGFAVFCAVGIAFFSALALGYFVIMFIANLLFAMKKTHPRSRPTIRLVFDNPSSAGPSGLAVS